MSTNESDMQQQIRQTVQQLMTEYGATYKKNADLQNIDWSKLSADDLRAVLNSAVDNSRQSQLNTQMLSANQLQDAAARAPSQGQSVQTGSVYIPPNPLSTGINLANQLQAMRSKSSAQSGLDSIDARNSNLPELFRKIFQRKKDAASSVSSFSDPSRSDYDEDDTEGQGDY